MKKKIIILFSVLLFQSCNNNDDNNIFSNPNNKINLSRQWIMNDNTITCTQGNAFGTLIVEFNKDTNKVALFASNRTSLPVTESNYSLIGNYLSFQTILKLNFTCENSQQNSKTITFSFNGTFNGSSFDGNYNWNETLENNLCSQPNTCNGDIQLYEY